MLNPKNSRKLVFSNITQLLLLVFGFQFISAKNHTKPTIFADFGILHKMDILSFFAQGEDAIYPTLQNRLKNLFKISKYLQSFKCKVKPSNKLTNKLDSLPQEQVDTRGSVLLHIMTHRYSSLLQQIMRFLSLGSYKQSQTQTRSILQIPKESSISTGMEMKWPNKNDLYMSHVGISSIKEYYDIPVDLMQVGLKADTEYSGELRLPHLEKFAAFTLTQKFHYMTLEWVELLQERMKIYADYDDHNHNLEGMIQSIFHVAVQSHNRKYFITSLKYNNLGSSRFLYLYTGPYKNEKKSVLRSTIRDTQIQERGYKYGNGSAPELNEIILCNDKQFQPIAIRSKMSCYLERKTHPYFILNPVKAEILSEHPPVIQFYEVLVDSLIEELYTTRGLLRMSTTQSTSSIDLNLFARTSAGSGVCESVNKEIIRRSKMFTGLHSIKNYDGVQNAEYVYGRMFRYHNDPLKTPDVNSEEYLATGNRLATVLYYADASENLQGGLTPFCKLGIAVYPVRGSAVFWLNMFRNGTFRNDVYHSACPVIHGSKLILNHWISYNPNFQSFKCSLNQFE